MFTTDTLSNQRILVTGGGSGLGLSMTKMFASLGAETIICGRNADKLSKAALEIAEVGKAPETFSVDVRDYEAVSKMFEHLEADGKPITGLVNNAAGNFLSASEELSPNAFKSVVDIVLTGTFNCSQIFGKRRIDAKQSGNILNIVTTYTSTGSSFVLPSACAKAGVEAMTKTLAFEWATYGFRVNAIAPGAFPTKGAWQRLLPDDKIEKIYLSKIPMNRYGEHKELANLAAFLMSDMANFINGETITIDGGEVLQSGQFNFVAQMMPRQQLKSMFDQMKAATKK